MRRFVLLLLVVSIGIGSIGVAGPGVVSIGVGSFGAADERPSPAQAGAAQAAKAPASSFASTIASLSEPGGYFNTDNLISNERSYLHVVPELRALKAGGVYLGVGPDQNFSYIAHVRPSLAILVDVRRDNLLLHLLFKALFAHARTRVEYLAMLTGRAPPDTLTGWERRPIEEIVAYIDRAPRADNIGQLATRDQLAKTVRSFGVPMTPEELGTIVGFHARFVADGLSLQFNTTGRPPQFHYPTYRDLLLELDRAGAKQNFFASEESPRLRVLHVERRVLSVPERNVRAVHDESRTAAARSRGRDHPQRVSVRRRNVAAASRVQQRVVDAIDAGAGRRLSRRTISSVLRIDAGTLKGRFPGRQMSAQQ